MIARSSSQACAYLYAQTLDNSGDSLCWLSKTPGEYQEIDYADPRRTEVLRSLDHVHNNGRLWPVGSDSFECKVTFQGDCLIKINPLTRDFGGRLAPIVLIFNVYDGLRQSVARMLLDCEKLMRRDFSVEQRSAIDALEKILSWPVVFIAMHIFIFSRGLSR
ncbi:hypothetical protein [Pseudomonas sp. PGPPP4]|uniref:hypothetical protein n=1 Tax=Pseudomonas sp. PGPPP4 TaxID=2015556 RepID=UPI00257D1286|nr:hypothetical protein [Pseudomonas sp. PGPPP4]